MEFSTFAKLAAGLKVASEVVQVIVKNYYDYNTDPNNALHGSGNIAGSLGQYTTATKNDTYSSNN